MKQVSTDFLNDVANYYSIKLSQHGETPLGVDWNGLDGQNLRFAQLSKIVSLPSFSINDLGCGYGALFDYLNGISAKLSYRGYDVSSEMIKAANLRYENTVNATFKVSSEPDEVSDYGVASGIFNVRLGRSDAEWFEYLEATLDLLNRTSSQGFAFNCLTSYSDSDKMRDYLYYANPCVLFDLCKRKYSRNVSLLHDYGLYEFTILVRNL
jgi:SAM-dependent methyltransferase